MAVIVADLMSKDVASVHAEESCAAAAQLMWERDCGAVPVLDAGSKVIGMLTDRDICIASWSKNVPPGQIRVADAMSSEVHCCTPDESLQEAEHTMRSKQVRRLPVIDPEFHVVGLLSLADIARRADPQNGALVEQVGSMLATIVQPPQPEVVISLGG